MIIKFYPFKRKKNQTIKKTVSASNRIGVRARKEDGTEVFVPFLDLGDKSITSSLSSIIQSVREVAPEDIIHVFMAADSTKVGVIACKSRLAVV